MARTVGRASEAGVAWRRLGRFARVGIARARGRLMPPLWRLRALFGGPTVVVGRRLSIERRLVISGPGTVVLGNDVSVGLETVLYTINREARIEIGDRVFLNGTRVNCAQSVRIGRDSMIGRAWILDTDYHSTSRRRRTDPTLEKGVGPVDIAENVWIATQAGILKGVSIGQNAVVSFGAVVVRDVPPDRIVGGNPAVDLGPVPE